MCKSLLNNVFVVFGLIETLCAVSHVTAEPKFSAPIANVTVAVGREAVLTCIVHDLVFYKKPLQVAWLRVDTQTILTIQNHVITKNHRIGISHTEKRIWQLRIRDVKRSDKGWYMCQINTDPMKSQLGYLDVVIPPDILDFPTSQDLIVKEGDNITLTCAAIGSPEPIVTWKREHGAPLISYGNEDSEEPVFAKEGSTLHVPHATRYNTGAYLCIASNGVPPTVSKRITVIVNFAPKIWVQNRHMFTAMGQKITLECHTESNPNSINYWMRSNGDVAHQDFVLGGTYETTLKDHIYKVVMKLVVRPTKFGDFGVYKCVAKNALGSTEEIIKVHAKSRNAETTSSYQKSNFLGTAMTVYNNSTESRLENSEETYMSAAGVPVLHQHLVIYTFIVISYCSRNL